MNTQDRDRCAYLTCTCDRAATMNTCPLHSDAEATACAYDTTRTSPFGYYGQCACGWITPDYWPTAQAAYLSVRDHVTARADR